MCPRSHSRKRPREGETSDPGLILVHAKSWRADVGHSEVGTPHPHAFKSPTPNPDREAGQGQGIGCPHETEIFCSL